MGSRLSPTGSLLRTSRLFALPSTLSPPIKPATSQTVHESDTATHPYPLRAAIETPPSSLARGDWGLKRPLPSKSTSQRSQSPVVRVNHLDTHEHITDFDSALDHVVTLRKWQELHQPISQTVDTGVSFAVGGGRHESVFEDHFDNTHLSANRQNQNSKRYRFRGPWLAGQTEADFERFLKTVRQQKPEFVKWLRQVLAEQGVAEGRRLARSRGEDLTDSSAPEELSDAEFNEELRRLRADPTRFGPLINKFFDLATPPKLPARAIGQRGWTGSASDVSSLDYAEHGPPKTHPSAGLSYLRTLAGMDNHPVAGPQLHSRPVEARLLRSKNRLRATTIKAVVGVGGISADDAHVFSFSDRGAPGSRAALSHDNPGGPRFLARTERAAITSEGKVNLKIGRARTASVALYNSGQNSEKPLPESVQGADRNVPRLDA